LTNDNNKDKENSRDEASGASGSGKKPATVNKDKKVLAKKDSEKTTAKKEKSKPSWFDELKGYLRGVVSEVKKVHWLGPREVVIYTIVVFVAVLFVGSLIWIFDMLLNNVLRMIMVQ